MSIDAGSIDDLLTQTKPSNLPNSEDLNDNNSNDSADSDYGIDKEDEIESKEVEKSQEDNDESDTKQERNFDDYGNEKAAPKTYTEDEVNERINKAVRERLSRANNQSTQPTNQQQQQVQQQAQDFEYDPNSDGNWQQQLEQFVEQTFSKMTQRQAQKHQQEQERVSEAEFVDKFSSGMDRFHDFKDVVGNQPITDPMTLALRGITDPAAFIYAASKRHPAELERISKIKDPYSQMVQVGRLEERMRKRAEGTKAPRPIGRSSEDSTMNYVDKKTKEDSIEDLITKSEQKKLAKIRQLRGK